MPAASSAVEIKSPHEISIMREAGMIVAQVLKVLREAVVPGISTGQLDQIAESEIRKRKAVPAFLGYRGYTATLCASINQEVVHGIPDVKRKLKPGDIVGLDLGCIVDGYYGDAAITVPVGKVSKESADLVETTQASLYKGIEQMQPGNRIGDISHAVQSYVESKGYSVVRAFVGHGIGRALHESPAVPNYGRAGTGLRLVPGMVLAVEPMVNQGGPEVHILNDGWTAVTDDEKWSAHFEHTIAVTEDGPEILTEVHG